MGSNRLLRYSCYFIFFICYIFTVGTSLLHAQQDSIPVSASSKLTADGKTILSDAGTVILMPFHFGTKEWINTGAVVGGMFLLMSVDQQGRDFAQRSQSGFNDRFFNATEQYGVATYGVIGSIGLYAGGIAFGNNNIRETGLELIEALGFAGAATNVGKVLFARSRPYTGDGPHKFNFFRTNNDYLSFPSGHTVIAFTLSSTLSERIKNPYATAVLYSAAGCTAYARMYHDQHWLSDAFAGAVLGTFMGVTVSHLHENSLQSISLYPSPNGIGMAIQF